MTPTRKIPEDIYETPTADPTPDRPSGSWPRRIEDAVIEMGKDLHVIKRALVGTLNEDGIAARVRKLEAGEKTRGWWTKTTAALALGALFETVRARLTGH